MTRVQRWDFAPVSVDDLEPAKRTAEGYLEIEMRAARVGRQDYDGVAEMREAADVFAPASLATWERRPLTNQHPVSLLTPETAPAHAVGAVSEPRRVGDWVVVKALVHDQKTIEDLYAGRVQVSAGYSCRLEPQADGMPRQREIQINHVALVDAARAGENARARLDGSTTITTTRKDTTMDRKMKIGDAEYDVSTDDGFKGAMKAHKAERDQYDAMQAQLDAMKEEVPCPACKADDPGDGDGDPDDVMDAGAGGDDEQKCDLCDGAGKVPRMVADWHSDADELETEQETESEAGKAHADALERMAELLVVARQHLGAAFRFDGRKPHQVRKLIVEKITGKKMDGKSPAYVAARLDAELERPALSAADLARAGTAPHLDGRAPVTPPLRGRAALLAQLEAVNRPRTDAQPTPAPASSPVNTKQARILDSLPAKNRELVRRALAASKK